MYTKTMSDDKVDANNTVQITPEGIIALTQTGYQTKASIAQFQTHIDRMTADMHEQGRKVLVLVDISGVTGQDPDVLMDARERLKGDYDALALYGTSPAIRMIINWLVHATGGDQRLRSFSDRQEAVDWLLTHQQ